jgi:ribonucleoside-diphosphate reductase alpha chain
MRAEDSREGWSELLYKASMALMTGAGIGIVYSDVRENGSPIHKTGGLASGPISLMEMVNECGRHIMQGGSRRSAIWAGLHWNHPDIFEFISAKNWSPEVRTLKEKDFNFPATLDMTNISVILDDDFFEAYENEYHVMHNHAVEVYMKTTKAMLKTAEPGFSIDAGPENKRENLRNACTEVTSEDDSDICNLGSINLARVETLAEFEDIVQYATLFLLAGTVYSDVPYQKVDETRTKNRRLGLGLMGIHEWLLKRGYKYEPCNELAEWLESYTNSDGWAKAYANTHNLTPPVKTRAIAPTGTIGIIAETTTGIEPIFCVAYKRRYLDGKVWKHQFVVDPTARKLIEKDGIDPYEIEDAYSLAYNVERRIAFQAFVQKYVDHGISSTVNLPYPVTDPDEVQDFADMAYKYLPHLRGFTCYPDGSRGGQPLSSVPYDEAIEKEGVIFSVDEDQACIGGACGV